MDEKITNVPRPDAHARPEPRAQTMKFQGAANVVMRGLLRTPLLCRVVGKWLMTVYVVGRKTGKRYSIPVAYVRHDGRLMVGTPFGWGRNLRTGEPARIRLMGKVRTADVEVVKDEAGVVAWYATMSRENHQFASFNKIAIDKSGEPSADDLRLAYKAGARAFLFTPR